MTVLYSIDLGVLPAEPTDSWDRVLPSDERGFHVMSKSENLLP